MASLDDIDPGFVARLLESERDKWVVARWLGDTFKQHVTVRALRVRPTSADRAEYADQGDLEIVQTVEVKHDRTRMFTGAADYPFADVLVDNVNTYDRKQPKPYAYVILNADATYAAVVKPAQSFAAWTRRDIRNHGDGYLKTVYCVPLEHVMFYRLPHAGPTT